MHSASIMAAPSAAGHGTNVGTRKTQSGIGVDEHERKNNRTIKNGL